MDDYTILKYVFKTKINKKTLVEYNYKISNAIIYAILLFESCFISSIIKMSLPQKLNKFKYSLSNKRNY